MRDCAGGSEPRTVGFRIEPELLKVIDKETDRRNRVEPGPRWTRSDTLRALVIEGIESVRQAKTAVG